MLKLSHKNIFKNEVVFLSAVHCFVTKISDVNIPSLLSLFFVIDDDVQFNKTGLHYFF